jgi:tetratricopeptide (TPR) repeat protein
LSIKENDVTILKYIAIVYYLDKEFAKSIEMFNKATTIPNADPEAFTCRGFAYLASGDSDASILDFTRALFIASADFYAYMGRGIGFINIGRYKAAIADFNSALALSSDNPFIYLKRGEASALSGEYTKAMADLNRACALEYNAVCLAIKQAKAEIAASRAPFQLQYSKKSPDHELYDIAKRKLENFYSTVQAAEINKYFVEKLRPIDS